MCSSSRNLCVNGKFKPSAVANFFILPRGLLFILISAMAVYKNHAYSTLR